MSGATRYRVKTHCSRAIALIALLAAGCSSAEHRRDAEQHESATSPVPAAMRDGDGSSQQPGVGSDCRTSHPTSSSIRIASETEPGEPLVISGVVRDEVSDTPLSGVSIYAYHTDAKGFYSREGPMKPRLCGKLVTGAGGAYRITTIRPGAYPEGGNPSHVHFEFSGDAIDPQHAELLFAGDPHLTEDFIEREVRAGVEPGDRAHPVRPVTTAADGTSQCERDFRLRTRRPR